MNKGILVLEDGEEFPGFLIGAPVNSKTILDSSKGNHGKFRDRGYGEVVFNTSMTGYQEILTDPSYYGQIVCMTYPHIGNTGVNLEDPESDHPWCAGFLFHEITEEPSNWRSQGSLVDYLSQNGIPALYGIDTRGLTQHLRSRGVVRGLILPWEEKSKAKELLAQLPSFEGRDLIGEVTTSQSYTWKSKLKDSDPLSPVQNLKEESKKSFKVVAMDFGAKWNLLQSLDYLGCQVEVVSARTTAEEILAMKPDGLFLSNGPGDPSAAPYAAKTVSQLIGKLPIFGVCMGHQILALALGARTYKLKFGHRGGNQPVLDQVTGRVEISSHNHGYAVDGRSLPSNVEVTHMNLNDKTVEGLSVKNAKAFSVQYHPEACPGPHDSMGLFERFVDLMRKHVSEIPRTHH